MLRRLLLKIRDAGLTINRDKSKFCVNEVKYLGFTINEHGLAIDPEKTEAIRNYSSPRTVREVQRFNGIASWLRPFIKDYATIASPLTDITKNPTDKFNWGKKEDDAFNLIKQKITDAPVTWPGRRPPRNIVTVHCEHPAIRLCKSNYKLAIR